MKEIIFFNCTTNVVGGAIQNAVNFISNAIEDEEFKWLFLVSSEVNKELINIGIKDTYNIIEISPSPARNYKSRRRIISIENELKPNLVFTMAGPAYVKFKSKHIMGLSNPYLTHADIKAFIEGRNIIEIIRILAITLYQAINANKANFFIFQTKTSRDVFCKRFNIDVKRTEIVPNAIGEIFNSDSINLHRKDNNTFTIFCPAAAYSHKCLHLIPLIAKELLNIINNNIKIKFILTIPYYSSLWKKIHRISKKNNVLSIIENIGPFSYKDAPQLYCSSDIVFIPSILETFSTSYLEAMIVEKPLVVVNKPFSKEICGNYAEYINPCSIISSADKLKEIVEEYRYYSDKLKNGITILNKYGNQKKRFKMIKGVLRKVLN